jgi:hypothetical protein
MLRQPNGYQLDYQQDQRPDLRLTYRSPVTLPSMQEIPPSTLSTALWGYIASDLGCYMAVLTLFSLCRVRGYVERCRAFLALQSLEFIVASAVVQEVHISTDSWAVLAFLIRTQLRCSPNRKRAVRGCKAPSAAASVPNMSIYVFALFLSLGQLVNDSYTR